MTRLYENRNLWRRTTLLAAFLGLVMLYGVWEFWAATQGPTDSASTGTMFGVLFLGGGAYALYQLVTDTRDLVSTLDRDPATGTLTAVLWQPRGMLTLTAPESEFRNWRSHVKVAGRNARNYFIYADYAGHPRPLRFDLKPGTDVSALRQVAPEAVAEYEAASGRGKPAAT